MKKLLITFAILISLVEANPTPSQKYNSIAPKSRSFKTVQEFKHHTTKELKHSVNHHNKRYINISPSREYRYHSYHAHRAYPKAQRGYRHFQRSWFYAYRYTKADFVDRYGFYYGYFDRRGYMFEGEFYRYDRDYRYQDRLKGRGLFDRSFYYAPLPRIYRDDI
jgi:hypothetical protein